jgi:diaminopimelate decarboxylase
VVRDAAGGRRALPGPIDVTGYTCMEIDVLQRGFPGELAVGDFLVFGNVGAYTSVFKPPFIRPAPAMLATTGRGDAFSVARRGETLDDVLATYALPGAAEPR